MPGKGMAVLSIGIGDPLFLLFCTCHACVLAANHGQRGVAGEHRINCAE
jgi:hypothetical protein